MSHSKVKHSMQKILTEPEREFDFIFNNFLVLLTDGERVKTSFFISSNVYYNVLSHFQTVNPFRPEL